MAQPVTPQDHVKVAADRHATRRDARRTATVERHAELTEVRNTGSTTDIPGDQA